MAFLRWASMLFLLWTGVVGAQALGQARDPAQESPEPDALTIWVVLPGTAGPRTQTRSAQVRQPTEGSQSAGSMGQTAGSFGQVAGNVGTAAGNVGRGPGSVGRAAGELGQSAGSIGQSAGSFGESLSTIAQAAAASNTPRVVASAPAPAKHGAEWDPFERDVRRVFPGFRVNFVDVGTDELQKMLEASAGTADAPDALLGTPLPWTRDGQVDPIRRFGLLTLGFAGVLVQGEELRRPQGPLRPEVSILRDAPHPGAVRAFVIRLSDERPCWTCGERKPELEGPIAAATEAFRDVLSAAPLGRLADPEMAEFDGLSARWLALAPYPFPEREDDLHGLRVYIDAGLARANDRFAVVELRAILENDAAFGAAHAVVVLRTDDRGQWRVLQITPNLPPDQVGYASRTLAAYSSPRREGSAGEILGISQAAPVDGDNRPPQPELWWDNKGGASLQVVEWQMRTAKNWMSSNLFFVPDTNSRLRTRVVASFASSSVQYRWRVWSMGAAGAMALSPWRTLNIVSR